MSLFPKKVECSFNYQQCNACTVHPESASLPSLNTFLKQLWHQLQLQVFLRMMLQAWLFLGIFSHSSLQNLSSWMGSIGAQPFSDLSRDVQSGSSLGSSLGSSWTTQWHSQSCHKATLLLSYGRYPVGRLTFTPVWGPEYYGAGFQQGCLCTLLHSSFSQFCFIGPDNVFSHGMRVIQVPFTEEWLLSGHYTIQAWLVDCYRDGCSSGRFSSLHREMQELCQSDHQALGHLPD